MIYLKQGDRLPIVAACQVLLNAYRLVSPPIVVDGVFGSNTREATVIFQRQNSVPTTGRIDADTWTLLAKGNRLRVHDTVDIYDPLLTTSLTTLRAAGAAPALLGGLCNGVGALQGQMIGAGVEAGKLVLLRFHGHGNKGVQAISYGTGWHVLFDAIRGEPVRSMHRKPFKGEFPAAEIDAVRLESLHSQISVKSLEHPDVAAQLASIAPLLHPMGSVEFHGCQVGGGTDGERMLRRVADLLGVPAVGARHKQTTDDAVRYFGPIDIQVPGGGSLSSWGKQLPEVVNYG